ncbi:hypothetical protein D6D29_07499 [Aureobasidium pullulans]|nr:hypothetical protein D6D29_07499 [Aureobasidium pullulans]
MRGNRYQDGQSQQSPDCRNIHVLNLTRILWKESLRGKESWRCEDAGETEKRRSVLTKRRSSVARRENQ